jgi:hypothetical protein
MIRLLQSLRLCRSQVADRSFRSITNFLTCKIAFGVVILSLLGSPVRADLVTNGSFETPVVAVGGFANFGSGSTAITGWTVVGPQASPVSGSYIAGCCHFPAEDGVQWLDLTGDVSNVVEGVEQTIVTTPGVNYDLSYFVGNVVDPTGFFGTTSTVNVFVDGGLVQTAVNSGGGTTLTWEKFNVSFKATTSSTVIEFLNGDPRSDNSNGLDNVSVVEGVGGAVPEPASMALFGTALLGLGLLRRFRKA